jgi:hypothetical protein
MNPAKRTRLRSAGEQAKAYSTTLWKFLASRKPAAKFGYCSSRNYSQPAPFILRGLDDRARS